MLRARMEGKGGALPESVLAIVEARLEELEPDARLLLRAASIFGMTFWKGGVLALLGEAASAADVSARLAGLEQQKLVARSSGSRVSSEEEWTFQQAAFREAAHAMLTDADASLGHRLAGDWLERMGEPSAFVLANHFETWRRGSARSGAFCSRGPNKPSPATIFQRRSSTRVAASRPARKAICWALYTSLQRRR